MRKIIGFAILLAGVSVIGYAIYDYTSDDTPTERVVPAVMLDRTKDYRKAYGEATVKRLDSILYDNTKLIAFKVKKGVWSNPGVWIPTTSYIRLLSNNEVQPFEIKIDGNVIKANLTDIKGSSKKTFFTELGVLHNQKALEVMYPMVSNKDKIRPRKEGEPVVLEQGQTPTIIDPEYIPFIHPQSAQERIFVRVAEDSAVPEMEILLLIDELTFVEKKNVSKE